MSGIVIFGLVVLGVTIVICLTVVAMTNITNAQDRWLREWDREEAAMRWRRAQAERAEKSKVRAAGKRR